MSIQIRSFNQILGDMIRKIIAETPLNDLNAGSVLLTLLEAAAANDFENNAAILNVLELLNIDAIKNNDLDAKAADFGLSRQPAVRASGFVDIMNTNIKKRSTGLYVIKPAPIAGQTKLYVNDTTGWAPTGSLYIGRGTENFEGPINYTSIVQYPTYSEITLASALQKDHLISDIVIDSQGEPDRVIAAGTIVKIPANNQNPEVQYATLRDAVIPAGEDIVRNVEVVALVPGSIGNAGINTITQFDTLPFPGAAVTNTTAFSNGKDIETDTQLRNRIKSYAITLARGTAPSIISAVIGVSDQEDSKQVASAVLTEPVKVGSPSIMYIDDGSGFQPSYTGQAVDVVLDDAEGTEEFLQLSNFPIPRPQVVNVDSGPFNIPEGAYLRVVVDGTEETVYFTSSQFLNISAATLAEVIVAINSSSTLFKARFTNNSSNILLYPVAHDAETIQVSPMKPTDNPLLYANSILKFPTEEFSYIALYHNSTRLKEKARRAELTTTPYSQWNVTSASNIVISVDGTPDQDRMFALSDFSGASSFSSLTLQDWVEVFNKKFAGVTAEATPSQTMIIRSNKEGDQSELKITGGTLFNKWFANLPTYSKGQSAQFELNRQTGNLRILTNIAPGDTISAGVEDAKGFVVSAPTNTGMYNFSSDSAGRPAEMVVVVDSTYCNKMPMSLTVGGTFDVTAPDSSTMRLTSSSAGAFAFLKPGDYIYIAKRSSGWFSNSNTGLFKVKSKGKHTNPGVDTYVDLYNINTTVESSIAISDIADIKAFETDGFPQVWRGSYLSNPPSEPIFGVIESLNRDLIGVLAKLYKTNSIKITSNTEKKGSIAIPVSVGNCSVVFSETASAQLGNPPHVATKTANKTMLSFIKTTYPTDNNVFLDRHIYTDKKALLTANSAPDVPPFSGTYSEIVQSSGLTSSDVDFDDYLFFTRGSNRGQIRSIKDKIGANSVGTQQGTARTEMDHVVNDELELVRPVSISSDDSIVFVVDKDPSTKTIDVSMSRTGRVNSGSGMGSFIPTTTEFSAFDHDNEPGIDFSNVNVWGKTINKTEFADYAVWMRARNWYSTGGVSGTGGKMLVRAAQYGPNGEKLRFSIRHPSFPDKSPETSYVNTPSWSMFTYFFGSGPARTTAISAGDTISVQGPYPDDSTNFPSGAPSTGNYYDYTFSPTVNLATVVVGDVLSIVSGSGVSNSNAGQFRVANKSGQTVRVFNPNATVTSPGAPEVTSVTTVADVVGTPTIYDVFTVPDVGGSLHLTYFTIYDTQGSVAVWYDVNNTGAVPPTHGANRAIKVATVSSGDSANVVAMKTAQVINLDSAFSTTVATNQITITNTANGPLPAGTPNTSGFTVNTTPGTPDNSLDRKYFIIHDDDGSVAVWYDVDNNSTPEPFHGADRSIKVSTVMSGDSAATVAAATATALNLDPKFSATAAGNVITITNSFLGNVLPPSAGTSGFTVTTVSNGSFSTAELITNPGNVMFFPINGTDVGTIASTVNAKNILEITPIGSPSLTITKATVEDDYVYGGNSTALGFGHNPNSAALRGHIALYDGVNWVKSFQNANPNFTMKKPYTLNGVAPSMYQMHTAPNYNASYVGELFKLIPVTVQNIHHHLTQKALSQLPIVANIRISNDRKNIQITSKKLGSAGAIEVVGGNANRAKAYILSESEVATDSSGSYLLVKIPAFPDTFNVGDYVKLENDSGVKRFSRLIASDTIDVTNSSSSFMEYNYNPKTTNISATTTFTITDVSSSYGRPPGFVWRWTHSGAPVTLAQVKPGDQVMAFGPTLSWDQGNKAGIAGNGMVAGLPIIAVSDTSNYFDVVNPHGKPMTTPTAVGAGNTVQICPTPIIRWKLAHAARVKVTSITATTSTITVTCDGHHLLNTGDSVDIQDSSNLPDGTYTSVTVISPNQFTISYTGPAFSENPSTASIIKTGLVPTRYRVEKLGFNNLVRISRYDGESPRFVDCGVAVDDYVILSGTTFAANNNGVFRVLAVDNDSIVIENPSATDEINTIRPFNNKNISVTWTANVNVVTGPAGAFKNLNVGDWVKKPEDPDSHYRQILSFSPSSPALATQITLGDNYPGASSVSMGVAYDQQNDYYKGVTLQNYNDITVLEGDSVMTGDTLYIQNITNSSWFSPSNTGSFEIIDVGTNSTTYKPFIRVKNPSGIPETNRLMSVDTAGLYIVESLASKFYSIRQVQHVALDDLNPEEKRSLYLVPSNRSYKFSNANKTSVTHIGKLSYNTGVTTGIDGYLYYTGLLRKVQRIVDGYEPDSQNFPGRRAIGSSIEILPPLIRKIKMSLDITTNEGVNLGEISNNIKSVIINYVQTLGVGQDVILSEIIAAIMQVKGVEAVTFTNPAPSTERITIANNEKAIILPEDIGLA